MPAWEWTTRVGFPIGFVLWLAIVAYWRRPALEEAAAKIEG